MNSFAGIVVTVSHDRYFLDNVVDRIFEFTGNGLSLIHISYDDLGTEAIRKLEVENFPVIVVIDSKGRNLYDEVCK